MLEELKGKVCEANKKLPEYGLVTFTWGNVSAIHRESGLLVIKPSGVEYQDLSPENMVVVNLSGQVVEGNYKPSSDTPTHIELYKGFPDIGGVVHTHSTYAASFAQAVRCIPAYGTTHADYFYGAVPCTRVLTAKEIEQDYEKNTGKVIAKAFAGLNENAIPGVVVANHGPFTWGRDAKEAVYFAKVLEETAKMAVLTESLNIDISPIGEAILDKHYFRNPEVRKFADDTLEEIICKYGVKYLKIDYNINAGIGTDWNADSAVTPEQAAVWSYPSFEADEEETCFNMVNAMLGRVHQSGFLNKLPAANFERIKEGIACYKSIRQDIKTALPKFPLGLIGFSAPWAAAALDCGTHWYLSVWRKDGENATQEIPLAVPEGKTARASCIYPKGLPVDYEYDESKRVLRVTLREQRRARFFKIEWRD